MFPYGAARGNLDLTGRNPARTEEYRPGADLAASMDGYGPYRGPPKSSSRLQELRNPRYDGPGYPRGRDVSFVTLVFATYSSE